MILFPIAALVSNDPPDLDKAVKQLYAVISGPAGQARDWQAFRDMFLPEARFVIVVKRQDGSSAVVVSSPDDYAKRSGPMLEKDGFFEKETWRSTRIYGNMAHVWTTYEGRRKEDDAKPFLKGINSVQFVKSGDKWKIAMITWTDENAAGPVPKEYGGG